MPADFLRLSRLLEKLHASLTGVSADQHHAQGHTLASHTTKAHAELTGVGTSDHHVRYTDAEALAAAWANINTKSLVSRLSNGDFEVGDPPTGWESSFPSGGSWARSTTAKIGIYSLAVLSINGAVFQYLTDYERYKGRNVSVGVWIKASVANHAQFSIFDGVGQTYSPFHPGDGIWRFIPATHFVSASATQLRPMLRTASSTDTAYFDGAILVEGDSCPAFSPKPDESLINHHTAAYTISAYETGHVVHTNLGASAPITITLPQTVLAGFTCHFAVMTGGQELRIDPGAAGAIYINGAKQTDDKYIWANDEGESITLVADGNGDWVAMYGVGTWGVEV